jgi:hypothetical protein
VEAVIPDPIWLPEKDAEILGAVAGGGVRQAC